MAVFLQQTSDFYIIISQGGLRRDGIGSVVYYSVLGSRAAQKTFSLTMPMGIGISLFFLLLLHIPHSFSNRADGAICKTLLFSLFLSEHGRIMLVDRELE